MATIGLFYGSDDGHTEAVAEKIEALMDQDDVHIIDIADAEPSDFTE